MILRLSRVQFPVTALGPGRRLAIWVQGCRLRCSGCSSVDTWDTSSGTPVDTQLLAPQLAELIVQEHLTGITLTGGEPTEQSSELTDLVKRVSQLLPRPLRNEVDVLLFTGLTEHPARRHGSKLWEICDAVVCGPYRADLPSASPLRASDNQQLVIVTEKGRERYEHLDSVARPSIQVTVTEGDINMVGLPNPGDLVRIEDALAEYGITLGGRSWATR